MSTPTDDEAAIAALPAGTRSRLEAFAQGLDRLGVDDLPLYVSRTGEEAHRQAVEEAERIARETGLEAGATAARHAIAESVLREYGQAIYRTSIFGMNTAPSMGPTEDRLLVVQSLGDAVTAIVLGPHLDETTQAELLGLWERLLP